MGRHGNPLRWEDTDAPHRCEDTGVPLRCEDTGIPLRCEDTGAPSDLNKFGTLWINQIVYI